MEKIKEFVKENWIWIVGGILLTAVILYLANKRQKKEVLRNPEGAIKKGKLVPTAEKLDVSGIKIKLDECNKKYASVRLSGNAVSPCAILQDQYNAAMKQESSYGCGSESGYGCGQESSYGGQFAGAFDKTNGLNITDFAMGMEGTALLEDKNL